MEKKRLSDRTNNSPNIVLSLTDDQGAVRAKE